MVGTHEDMRRSRQHRRAAPIVERAPPDTSGGPGGGPGGLPGTNSTGVQQSPTSSSTPPPPTSTSKSTTSIATSTTHSTTSTTPTTTSSSSSTSSTASSTSSSSSSSVSSSSTTSTSTTVSSTSSVIVPTTQSVPTVTTTPPAFSTGNPSLTNPAAQTTQTITGDTNTNTNAAKSSSISTGGIIGIIAGVVLGAGAVLIFTCWVRRKLRPRSDRYKRDSFMRNSMVLPGDLDFDRPVIGTSNAVALAKANMAHEKQPEMTQAHNEPAAGWAGYTGNAGQEHSYPPYNDQHGHAQGQEYYQGEGQHGGYYGHEQNQYGHGQYDQYQQDGHAQGQYGNYSQDPYASHQQDPYHHQQDQFTDISRGLDTPAVALTPAYSNPNERYDSHTMHSPPPSDNVQNNLGRHLSTSAYGSLSARGPSPNHPTRTGTPVDHNPQQAYNDPSGDDAYGGM